MGSILFFKSLVLFPLLQNNFFILSLLILITYFTDFFPRLFALPPSILSTIFQVLMLTGFLNLSGREHHKVQKNTLDFDHQNGSNLPLWWWLSSSTPSQHFPWWLRDFTAGHWKSPTCIRAAKLLYWSSLQAFVFIYGTWKWTGASWHRQVTKHHRRAKNPISAPAGRTRAWWRQGKGSPAVRLQLPWEELEGIVVILTQEPELRNVL